MSEQELEHIAQRPRWLDEEPALQQLLARFLDKIENTQRLSLRLTAKTIPELFALDHSEATYLWTLIKALDKEYHILTVKPAVVKPHQPLFDNAQLLFVPDKEPLVRAWLNRPRLDPYALLWEKYLAKYADHFADGGDALAENIIRVSHKSPEHIVRGFAQIGRELRERMTLRSLSARCFWGDSKFLERREDLVQALYPAASQLLVPRPILLDCYVAQRIERVLFVENQDSYLMLVGLQPATTALVYSAGFRGSAGRVRERGQAAFAQMAVSSNHATFQQFQHQWFASPSSSSWPVHFWGDLDFAGCAIIKSLRVSFPTLTAWQAGYRPLLERLERGEGHGHNTSGKELQKDPGPTGCAFTDEVLLPAIRATGTFFDQEAVLGSDLDGFQ